MIAETETVGLVQQFVERTGQLYSLPAIAAEVLRLTSEPALAEILDAWFAAPASGDEADRANVAHLAEIERER